MRRIDEIGFGGYRLIQDSEGFSYGVDAVLLSHFCCAGPKDNVLELGSGNGIVPLIINAKYCPKSITGIEVQPAACLLAEENARLNGLEEKIRFIFGDVKNIKDLTESESFDLVCSNPPYFEKGRGIDSSLSAKHIARHETTADLRAFIDAASYALKKGGRLAMVHRPSRLADIIEISRDCGLEPKRLQMVAPHSGEVPNIMLIECIKGGGKELKVLPGLSVRNSDGSYTEEINMIYGR